MSETGAWEDWLEYFLNGIARQAEDAVSRAQAIKDLLSRWHQSVAGAASRVPANLLDLLAENPFWTVKGVAERLEVAFTTAQRAVEKLLKLSILIQVAGDKRDRVYCARAIMDILDEPARLTPMSGSRDR